MLSFTMQNNPMSTADLQNVQGTDGDNAWKIRYIDLYIVRFQYNITLFFTYVIVIFQGTAPWGTNISFCYQWYLQS